MAHPVDDNPELAAAIGRMTNKWGHVEYRLALIFSMLAGLDLATGPTIFDFFKSTSIQKQVLLRLARLAPFCTDTITSTLEDVLIEYENLAKERNEISHNPFGQTLEQELYIMVKLKKPKAGESVYFAKPIAIEDINSAAVKIEALTVKFLAVLDLVWEAKFGSSPKITPEQPGGSTP